MEYSLEEMGRAIRSRREALGLTQEDLGTMAGYRGGAAVSISRVENGFTRPTREKLEGIARALDTTVPELALDARTGGEALAKGRDASGDREQLSARGRWISQEIERRSATETELYRAYNDSYDRANSAFLLPFGESLRAINGAVALDPDRPGEGAAPSAMAGALVRLQLPHVVHDVMPSVGVLAAANAVAQPVGHAMASGTLLGAMAFGTASTGVPTRELRGIAQTNAAYAVLGRGTRANGGAGIAGGKRLLAGIELATALLVAISPVAVNAVRSRKQQREFVNNLDILDAELRESQRGFEAFTDMMTRATALLEEIAVHAGRTLEKWNAELGPPPLDWKTLEPDLRNRCGELYLVAACQQTVDAIDYTALVDAQGDELEMVILQIDDELTRAQDVVASIV